VNPKGKNGESKGKKGESKGEKVESKGESRRPVDRPWIGLETLCASSNPSHARLESILGEKQAVTM
jgi:hypothetical protein